MRTFHLALIITAALPLCAQAERQEAAVAAVKIANECVLYSNNSIVAVVEGVDAFVCNETAAAISRNQSAESVVKALQEIGAEII